MEAWVWLAVYLIGFALLQLVLYRYFQRGESTHEQTETSEPGYKRLEGSAAASDVSRDQETDGDAVVCQNCGTLNDRDSMYSYCRECASPLR